MNGDSTREAREGRGTKGPICQLISAVIMHAFPLPFLPLLKFQISARTAPSVRLVSRSRRHLGLKGRREPTGSTGLFSRIAIREALRIMMNPSILKSQPCRLQSVVPISRCEVNPARFPNSDQSRAHPSSAFTLCPFSGRGDGTREAIPLPLPGYAMNDLPLTYPK